MGGVDSLWFATIGGVGLFVVTRPACNKAFGDFGAHNSLSSNNKHDLHSTIKIGVFHGVFIDIQDRFYYSPAHRKFDTKFLHCLKNIH